MENGKLVSEDSVMMLMKMMSVTGSKKKLVPSKPLNFLKIEKPKDQEEWHSFVSNIWKL
jgi:hypothetical protein